MVTLLCLLAGIVVGIILKGKFFPNPLQNTVESLQRELKTTMQENERLKAKIESLSGSLSQAEVDKKKMIDSFRSKEDHTDDLEDKIADLQRSYKRIFDENKRLEQELAELKMQYAARKQELESLQNKYDELTNK